MHTARNSFIPVDDSIALLLKSIKRNKFIHLYWNEHREHYANKSCPPTPPPPPKRSGKLSRNSNFTKLETQIQKKGNKCRRGFMQTPMRSYIKGKYARRWRVKKIGKREPHSCCMESSVHLSQFGNSEVEKKKHLHIPCEHQMLLQFLP